MASLLGLTRDGRGDSAVTIEKAGPARQRAALSVLLTGAVDGDETAVDQFERFARGQGLAIEELWGVYHRGQPVAAALIVPSAGRTAVLFISPLPRKLDDALLVELVTRASRSQNPAKATLVQALLDPQQDREVQVLEGAGYRQLARLLYMERSMPLSTPGSPAPGSSASRNSGGAAGDEAGQIGLEPGIELVHWSQGNRALFAAGILASYENTLDCPGLLGLRQIDDIIAGHMASGRFVPELWTALHVGGEPVGVMLLNLIPQRQALELVYLGLAQRHRGKGLGRLLLQHAMTLGPRHGAHTLMLAVDERNAPAMELYRSLRFSVTARKTAMIWVTKGGEGA